MSDSAAPQTLRAKGWTPGKAAAAGLLSALLAAMALTRAAIHWQRNNWPFAILNAAWGGLNLLFVFASVVALIGTLRHNSLHSNIRAPSLFDRIPRRKLVSIAAILSIVGSAGLLFGTGMTVSTRGLRALLTPEDMVLATFCVCSLAVAGRMFWVANSPNR